MCIRDRPYIYSEYMKAALKDEMMFRPLAFDYPGDDHAARVEDQLLLGDGMMLAPVYEQNAEGRYVYLPEKMKMVTMRSLADYDTRELEAGHHYIYVSLDEVVFFIRPDHMIPLSGGGQNVDEVDFHRLNLLGYVVNKAEYELYDDDGYTRDYENPENFVTITVSAKGSIRQRGTKKRKLTLVY